MQRLLSNTLLTVTCTFASFTFLLLPSFAQAWTIDSFDATIEVFEDASLLVEEEITVSFDEARHGIFRNIPVSYKDSLNNRVKIDLDLIEVLQDGEVATFVEYKSAGDRVFQIGNGDVALTGEHVYTIRYSVDRAMLFFEDYDELYWNVTGTNWEAPILAATAFVILPDGTEVLQTSCYTGIFASTEENCGIAGEDNLIAFVASDILTLAVGFEKNVIAQPDVKQKFLWFLRDNWIGVVPLFIILFIVQLWWRLGKDPKMETVVVEFQPPEEMWAAYTGMISRSVFASADLAGMIVQMAVKGYLSFEIEGMGSKRKVTLKKEKQADDLDPAHRLLHEHLFKNRETVTVKQLKGSATVKTLLNIRKELNKKIQADGVYVTNSKKRRNIVIGLAVFLFYVTFFLGASFGFFAGLTFFLAAAVTFVFGMLMPKKTLRGVELARKILGFKLFMHTAERYRSKWQEEQGLFEEFLPYAIVFGDTTRWAKTFSNMKFKNPSWYHSATGFVATDVFTKDLISSTHSMSRAAAPSSNSSGASGGGGSW